MKSRSYLAMIPAALMFGLLSGKTLLAQTGWLDTIDKQFEDTFKQSEAAFERAMVEGVAELDRELANIWGQSRQLPEPKVWVGYDQQRTTRIIVDYDKGEMTLESFGSDERQLSEKFQDILLEDSEQLNEREILRKKLIESTRKLSRKEFEWDTPERKPTFIKPKWKTRHELSQLIAPRTRPTFVKRNVIVGDNKKAQLSRLTIPLRKDRDQLSAQALRGPVLEAAQKYNLPRSLILSVIKNESAFNPRARSKANALGLMQLVATSGGKEAYSFLTGKNAIPPVQTLYDPYENILLGATYLHLLNTRYFGSVKDELARQYLVISAYNTGAGNVAKAFTGDMKLKPAIEVINQMEAQEIYDHLRKHLPYEETRTYLARVNKDTQTFASWDS